MRNPTRRDFIKTTAALSMSALAFRAGGEMAPVFNYSICNEVFEKTDFAESCRIARKNGWTGIEISPFTLADSVDDISAARRRELRDIIHSEGLRFAGLHWLLVTPKWLQVSTPDAALRARSWDYFLKLIDFCADLGGGVMVLGSPKQRETSGGETRAQATAHLTEGLARVAPHAGERRVTISLEALDHKQTDVVNTMEEAVAVVHQVNHPAVRTMFDYHNVADETQPSEELVSRYYPLIRHIHINEMDGGYPGSGHYDFLPVMRVLKGNNYRGWVSMEVFDFKPGAAFIARAAMEYLRSLEARL